MRKSRGIYWIYMFLLLTLLARCPRLQLLEEVIAFVIYEDECREVFYGNLPDSLHAELRVLYALDALDRTLREYFKNHPILYAGPAKTPEGYPCGSMGPTTANRMDPYVDEFQDHGASLVMIAKGNRGDIVTEACKKHGGFYLGTIGGVAAVLSQSSIKSIECVEYPELGMEAIWKITVEDFPAFILVDDKGNDFFKQLKPWTPCKECQK